MEQLWGAERRTELTTCYRNQISEGRVTRVPDLRADLRKYGTRGVRPSEGSANAVLGSLVCFEERPCEAAKIFFTISERIPEVVRLTGLKVVFADN